MPIDFPCSECNKLLRVADASAGKKARCPDCGNIQQVPPAPSKSVAEPSWKEETAPYIKPPEETPAPSAEAASPFGTPFRDNSAPSSRSSSENPYQSPAAAEPLRSGAQAPVSRYAIELKVQGPATALIALSVLVLTLVGIAAAAQIVLIAFNGGGPPDVAINLISAAISGGIYVVVLIGAMKMRKLQNYPLALTASILAAIPCFGCCVLGLPFGIWGIVVLVDPSVRAAFE